MELANKDLHLVFVYCYYHDQGAVAIITNDEWLDMKVSEKNYNQTIFKYVDSMCGSISSHCNQYWDCCGELEYQRLDKSLQGQNSVKTNFDRENGGWNFKYFKHELYTSKRKIKDFELSQLPQVLIEFLTHLDIPYQ